MQPHIFEYIVGDRPHFLTGPLIFLLCLFCCFALFHHASLLAARMSADTAGSEVSEKRSPSQTACDSVNGDWIEIADSDSS